MATSRRRGGEDSDARQAKARPSGAADDYAHMRANAHPGEVALAME